MCICIYHSFQKQGIPHGAGTDSFFRRKSGAEFDSGGAEDGSHGDSARGAGTETFNIELERLGAVLAVAGVPVGAVMVSGAFSGDDKRIAAMLM